MKIKEIKIGSIFKTCPFFLILIILLTYCVKPFNPDINEDVDLIVIDGSIIKGNDIQKITITRSSPLDTLDFIPVKGCNVKVTDNQGNEFVFEEDDDGIYTAEIDDDDLVFNRSYVLNVETSTGQNYISSSEMLYKSPLIDSIYYLTEKSSAINTNTEVEGLRLYIDLKVNEDGPRYFRWKIDDTWEYHSPYIPYWAYMGDSLRDPSDSIRISIDNLPIHFYPAPPMGPHKSSCPIFQYDTIHKFIDIPDTSMRVCWNSSKVYGLYTSNTLNLLKDDKKKIPLHFTKGSSTKLTVRYSCNVKQYAITEDAYNYWQQKKVELQESGGLYTTQPNQSVSNITNIDNPEETVLGYFWASSKSEKRIFYNGPFPTKEHELKCPKKTLLQTIKRDDNLPIQIFDPDFRFGPFPIYVMDTNFTTTNQECFDCRLLGGNQEKPDFWDEQ